MLKLILAVVTAAAFHLAPAPAVAQNLRSWVEGTGDDSLACTRFGTCRTFNGAFAKTQTNGEISVASPGNFLLGSTTLLDRSVSIVSDGFEAGLVNTNLTGFDINAGAAGVVSITGVVIEGGAVGGVRGIRILSAKQVTIRNCVIRNQKGASPLGTGIFIETTTATEVFISDCTIDNNTDGILVQPQTGVGGSANVFLDRVNITRTGTAIRAAAGATVRVHRSTITNNTSAIVTAGGGSVLSFLTNAVQGNASNETFTAPTIALK